MLQYTSEHYNHNPKLHIITIYFGNSERNEKWLELQKKFIRENTTIPYRLSFFLDQCDKKLFDHLDVVEVSVTPEARMEKSHLNNLEKAVAHFDASCDYCLILDSDCFPISEGWHERLANQMKRFKFQMAAPVRTENLDTFPHPCAMFMTRQGVKDLKLTLDGGKNLLDKKVVDPTCKNRCFPLVRTNRINLHYLVAGVYYDMFYHHGAGSRNTYFRLSNALGYYKPDQKRLVEIYEKFIKNPKRFISKLMTPIDIDEL